MRRTFFSLLILLIALRGMVGDAMAYGMTAGLMQQAFQTTSATEKIATNQDHMRANGHFLAEKTVSMPCHEAAEDVTADTPSHACTTCQVCHLSVSLPSRLSSMSAQVAHTIQATWESIWHSAELQPTQKPPIL